MDSPLDAFTLSRIGSETTVVRFYLIDARGQQVPNTVRDITVDTLKSLREYIGAAIGLSSPWVLPGVASWYRVVQGTGVYLGRNAVPGLASIALADTTGSGVTSISLLEQLLLAKKAISA